MEEKSKNVQGAGKKTTSNTQLSKNQGVGIFYSYDLFDFFYHFPPLGKNRIEKHWLVAEIGQIISIAKKFGISLPHL